MGLFKKKQQLSRSEFRKVLRQASPYIPEAGGKMYSQRERVEMEKKIFEKQYGGYISKSEYQKRLRELGTEKYRARTGAERLKIDRQIRFLKKLGGV